MPHRSKYEFSSSSLLAWQAGVLYQAFRVRDLLWSEAQKTNCQVIMMWIDGLHTHFVDLQFLPVA